MKVNHTFEFDLDLRFGVAMELTGELRPASRDECREWLTLHTTVPMAALRGNVEEIKRQMVSKVSATEA